MDFDKNFLPSINSPENKRSVRAMFDVAPKSCQKEGDNDFDGEQSGELTPGISQDIITREIIDPDSTAKQIRGGSGLESVAPTPAPFVLEM